MKIQFAQLLSSIIPKILEHIFLKKSKFSLDLKSFIECHKNPSQWPHYSVEQLYMQNFSLTGQDF